MNRGPAVSPLQVRGLNKRYGHTPVLSDLALDVAPASIHGLVGLNGSGKTTTLECILGCLPFDSGSIRVLGQPPDRLWRSRGDVVGLFDIPGLHPGLTVRQCLEHARLLCPRPVRTAEQVAGLLGITRYRDYRIRQLSLGNRRRAAIAQALLGTPAFLILDEPFNGLDAGGVDDVLALISRLNREDGTAFLLSSHQLPYLERICSHLSILHRGRIAVSDRVDELFSDRPERLYIRCDQPRAAELLLDELPGIVRHGSGEDGRLCLELRDNTAGEINRQLVTAGIGVSELLSETPSLESLFREITGDAAAPDEDREAAA